ncbi:MAG: hypothetical protein ACOCP3_01790 [Halodesulfurarchaeum sp.]
MSLIDITVDGIDIRTVPKLVLFDRGEGEEGDFESDAGSASAAQPLPVSPVAAIGVAIAATALAVGVWQIKKRIVSAVGHC